MKKLKTRVPRLPGTTQLAKQILTEPNQNLKEKLKDKIRKIYITTYINNGYHLFNKQLNIQNLSLYLDTNLHYLTKIMTKEVNKINQILGNEDDISSYARGLHQALFFWAMENGLIARSQVETLLASQSGRYKPFLTGEVNKSIANLVASTKPILDTINAMKAPEKGPNIAINNNNSGTLNTANGTFISNIQALRILEENDAKSGTLSGPKQALNIAPSDAQSLALEFMGNKGSDASSMPNVNARNQGDLSDIGIKTDQIQGPKPIPIEREKRQKGRKKGLKELNIIDATELIIE